MSWSPGQFLAKISNNIFPYILFSGPWVAESEPLDIASMLNSKHTSFQSNENYSYIEQKPKYLSKFKGKYKKFTCYVSGGMEEQKENKNKLFCQPFIYSAWLCQLK